MSLSDWILVLNAIAIVLAPIVALTVGIKLQRRSDSYNAKLDIFGMLIGLRHQPLAPDLVRALNQIDVVFADDARVREAWTRYLAALNDPSFNEGPGFALREEKRRDLLLEIVRSLGLSRKISSADLLRSYVPAFSVEAQQLEWLERLHKTKVGALQSTRLIIVVAEAAEKIHVEVSGRPNPDMPLILVPSN